MISYITNLFASYNVDDIKNIEDNSIQIQRLLLKDLIKKAKHTTFGKKHSFDKIFDYKDFKQNIPIRTYEDFLPYIEQIRSGQKDILWPDIPKYWAKTSGTTNGSKYIPITKESLDCHLSVAKRVLLNYINKTKKSSFVKGHMLLLSGTPALSKHNNIYEGRLSGIVNHHIPWCLKKNYLPTFETNSIEIWHDKLNKIADEALATDLTLISGIPPWVQMFFDQVLQKTSANCIKDVFPNLQIIIHGGTIFEPYKKKMFKTIGQDIDFIDTYPASEGFIAFQDSQTSPDLLLQTDSGIFYEFIPMSEISTPTPIRLSLEEVEIDVQYALIISNNAGLWAYNIGDTVKFTSKNPYKISITGRTKHFTSAFGEHIIAQEVDSAIAHALTKHTNTEIEDFTVAPYVSETQGKQSFHEWFIEFRTQPSDLVSFAKSIDDKLTELNPYYRDLIKDGVLSSLKITCLPTKSFENYMRSKDMLGGQNKVVHLTNDRKMVDEILKQVL